MKRYIRSSADSSAFLNKIDAQIRDYLGDDLISAFAARDVGIKRGGNIYIFKINDHNVYRVFVDTLLDEMVFQCIATAFYTDQNEYYDDAVDYKDIQGDRDKWFDLFKQWINECEADDPNFTHYEYEE